MKNHHEVNKAQYGNKSDAYLKSSVHAQGVEFAKMQAIVQANKYSSILDLGCGGGHVTYNLAALARQLVAYDITPEMVQLVADQAQQKNLHNVTAQVGAAEDLPFGNNSFDCIVSRYSAHHWQNVRQAMAAANRVLKSNGRFIMFDIIGSSNPIIDTFLQTIELIRDPSHVRNYSIEEWALFAEYADFEVESIETQPVELDFQNWVTRMQTPPEAVATVRYLQTRASQTIKDYYRIKEDGTFTSRAAFIVLAKH